MYGTTGRILIIFAAAGVIFCAGAAYAQPADGARKEQAEINRTQWRLHAERGQADLSAGRFAEADEAFTQALKNAAPVNEHHAIFLARGSVRLQLKNYAGAIDDFTNALKFEESGRIYLTRAIAHYAEDQLEQTKADASTALSLGLPTANEQAKAFELRAYALMRQGMQEAATNDFSSAVEIKPAPHLFFHRANLLRASGNQNAALGDYQLVVSDQGAPGPMAAQSYLGVALIYHARRDILNAMAAYDIFFSRLADSDDETRALGAQIVQTLIDAGLFEGPALSYDAKLRSALTDCVRDIECQP